MEFGTETEAERHRDTDTERERVVGSSFLPAAQGHQKPSGRGRGAAVSSAILTSCQPHMVITERERERQRQRQKERERGREREGEGERGGGRQTDRQREIETERNRQTETDRGRCSQTDRDRDRQTNRACLRACILHPRITAPVRKSPIKKQILIGFCPRKASEDRVALPSLLYV